TMKWDAAHIADAVPGADQLADELGLNRSKPTVVAGSTAPGAHEMLVKALPGWRRRSQTKGRARAGGANSHGDLYLLDTIGELRQAYALADVVVIGRSFGNLHGPDMIEPIALEKPTI